MSLLKSFDWSKQHDFEISEDEEDELVFGGSDEYKELLFRRVGSDNLSRIKIL